MHFASGKGNKLIRRKEDLTDWDILNFNEEVVQVFQNESEGAKCLVVHGF